MLMSFVVVPVFAKSTRFKMANNNLMGLKSRLGLCFTVLNEYSWLLDSYVLDFFTENHLEKLPKSWKDHLRHIPLEDFYYLLNFSVKTQNTVWPLSIICLRVLLKFFALPRKTKLSAECCLIQSNKINVSKILELSTYDSIFFKHQKLWNLFLKHVKPKKRHEIFRMATITADIANKLGVDYVVDVGSGMGHLSRIMAYGFNLKVCSIETQTELTVQAEKLDRELETTASKHLNEMELKNFKSKRPFHINQTITFDLTPENFVQILKTAFSFEDNNFKFGIIGLHPCGDLATVLLKLYSNSSEAEFINLVGCCYHKLSTFKSLDCHKGFPLTEFSKNKNWNASYEARALACHAIESYSERLQIKNYYHLKIHCYRAVLEKIIHRHWPQYRKSVLSNVKATPELTFSAYCKAALKKLDLNVPIKDLGSEELLRNLSDWEAVVKFYSLRVMLAPLVETAILLDRKIYLLERGFQCNIKAAFDPKISPRNLLLISYKNVRIQN